jgi:hypothetical protein
MKTTKTLNIDQVMHHLVKLAAAEAGVPIGVFAEALLSVGMGHPRQVRQLLESHTKKEQQQGKA